MKKSPLMMIAACLAALLSACVPTQQNRELTRIKFERGHGSAWGNQFYIEISPEEIVTARYIPRGSSELVTVEHIPITDGQWEELKTTVEQMPLEKARTDLWEKHKVDGTEFRKLTLVRGEKSNEYWWPNTPEAQQLEELLESLVFNEKEDIT